MTDKPPEGIEIMREMYNCPQDIQAMTYENISHVYFALRDAKQKIENLERLLSEMLLKRHVDHENKIELWGRYMKLARQYACECEKLCSEDWQDQDYCGWRAKKALE